MTIFQKAVRTQTKLKIAISGPSGSGKTMSALLIASGLGKRIALIDTENGSASLYAGMEKGPLEGIEFDVFNLDPPYTIQKYVEAIEAAVKAKYDVLVVDGISPAWAGEGGLLSKKEALDQRGGNSYTNWAGITKEHEIFKAQILQADIHAVFTLRSKQDYILEQNEKGKSVPRKVGLAPIQRDGMEYEFTTVFDLAMDHNAAASKDRTSLFDGKIFKPTRKTGEEIMAWLKSGKAAPVPAKVEPKSASAPEVKVIRPDEFNSRPALPEQLAGIQAGIEALHKLGIPDATIWQGIAQRLKKCHGTDVVDSAALTDIEAKTVIEYLAKWLEVRTAETKGKGKAVTAKAAALKKSAGK